MHNIHLAHLGNGYILYMYMYMYMHMYISHIPLPLSLPPSFSLSPSLPLHVHVHVCTVYVHCKELSRVSLCYVALCVCLSVVSYFVHHIYIQEQDGTRGNMGKIPPNLPMNTIILLEIVHSLASVDGHRTQFLQWLMTPFLPQKIQQRAARHQLHDDINRFLLCTHANESDDVWMFVLFQNVRLLQELVHVL